ncbi:hypothetical protein J132_09935 [Termitomyces sp. J132]|nr:hypothetical protein J132_09935 [Termitomyces sp. J132]
MVALLAPPPPGTTRSQADVSRLISTMWKAEKSEVKAEYERRAEVKKLEHAAMYPNYRYMPKSKEFKEELKKAKEERKKKKNKREGGQGTSEGSRSQAPRDLPFTSHAYPFLPADSSQYVQGGLSPPMSAADSIEQWGLQNPEFQPTLGLFFNNTSGDCYQLQINSLAHGNLHQTPVGPIEVEVGQVDFDFSQWQHSHAVGALEPLFNAPQENASFENTAGPSSQTSESSFEGSDLPSSGLDQGFQLDQYINFNPTFDYAGSSPSIEEDTMAPARAPYVPPSGAAHVGKRRVAGSWNTSYAIQDPIDV